MESKACKTCQVLFEPEATNQKNCKNCQEQVRGRKTKSRAKQKLTAEERAERLEQESAKRDQLKLYKERQFLFFAESEPGVNATTAAAEINTHRMFLRSLKQPDVQPGESLRQLSKRTWEAWLDDGAAWCTDNGVRKLRWPRTFAHAFNRKTQKFDAMEGFDIGNWNIETDWQSPKGCNPDAPIDIASLPNLPYRHVEPVEPKPVVKPTPVPPKTSEEIFLDTHRDVIRLQQRTHDPHFDDLSEIERRREENRHGTA